MSFLTINNVKIVGVSACVPSKVEENLTLPIFSSEKEARDVIESTGIERKHVVEPGTTASDLTVQAVQDLLKGLGWEASSVDALVYVCVSRDYIALITSAILQDRLGFRQDCYCIDLPLGCSGWVYGIAIPIIIFLRGIVNIFILWLRKPRSKCSITVAVLGAINVMTFVAEIAMSIFFMKKLQVVVSLVMTACCVSLMIFFIVMEKSKRLKAWMQRKFFL